MNAVEKIVAEIRSEVGPNQEIVFVSGNFNIIHPGHIRLLIFAAKSGDFLVVGINSKGSLQDVYIPFDLRIESAKG
ncbi:MAG: adenylyltransferase/cytidyltransferase family protein, partial [Bdellovibrionaceae bacterium]|nr:adenylyltransferase/cytidyltransferase family protein [Bdellovibrio sp.]